jgi:hypothetical protein
MTQATDKQKSFLSSLVMKSKRSRGTSIALDEAAQESFGYETWDEAPLSKRVISCLIDIYLGKADVGLFVWAVKQEINS